METVRWKKVNKK